VGTLYVTDRSGAEELAVAIGREQHRKDFLAYEIEALKEMPSKLSLMD